MDLIQRSNPNFALDLRIFHSADPILNKFAQEVVQTLDGSTENSFRNLTPVFCLRLFSAAGRTEQQARQMDAFILSGPFCKIEGAHHFLTMFF